MYWRRVLKHIFNELYTYKGRRTDAVQTCCQAVSGVAGAWRKCDFKAAAPIISYLVKIAFPLCIYCTTLLTFKQHACNASIPKVIKRALTHTDTHTHTYIHTYIYNFRLMRLITVNTIHLFSMYVCVYVCMYVWWAGIAFSL